MTTLRPSGRGWTYPLLIGLVIGALVAGLVYRVAGRLPESQAAAGGATVAGTTSPGIAAPVPGQSAAVGTRKGVPLSPGSGAKAGASSTTAGSGPSRSGPAAPSASTRGPLTASDVGVTPTTIKIGIALLDLGGASSFGASVPGYDPKTQKHEWQVFLADLNKRGGILGRKVQAYYRSVDVLSTQDQQAACVEFTQTDHVFLVVDWGSAMGADGDLCVTGENHTLDLSGAISPAEYYQEARGLLITSSANGTRVGEAWARMMQHVGKLQGHTLGLLVDQGTSQSMMNDGLVPALQSLGYKVAYTAVVSSDPSQGPSEVPPQVIQMHNAHVDTVFMASAFFNMTAFVNQADKMEWRPQYMVSDLEGDDVATLLQGMPNGFDGAIATSYYPFGTDKQHPESSQGRACRERWNKLTGSHIGTDDSNYGAITGVCSDVNFLQMVGTNTGTDLTRAGFSDSVQRLGTSFNWGGLGGSFGPGKTDYADIIRTMVWGPKKPQTASGYCTANQSRCFNDGAPPWNPGV